MPTLSFGSLKLEQVPRWVLALIALAATLGAGGLAVYERVYQPALQLSERDAEMREYSRHYAEAPVSTATLLDDPRLGSMTVARYADQCVILARRFGPFARSKIIADPARDVDRQARRRPPLEVVATVEAAGRCLDPHPCQPTAPGGPCFATWMDTTPGCWVKVWRQWPDGCQHYQMFDRCHGLWDETPDRAPRVTWTRCVH